jgi:hypothetical protein
MRLQARAARVALKGIQIAVAASGLPPDRQTTAAFYLLVTACNISSATVAEAYGCTRQNISKALRGVEDRRDDPAFGAAIDKLEAQIMGETLWS